MNNLPTPLRIFKLANVNPMIRQCVELWKHGGATWEQAMMLAVTALADQCQGLARTVEQMMMQSAMSFMNPFMIPRPPKPPSAAPVPAAPVPEAVATPPPAADPAAAPMPGPMPVPAALDAQRILHVLVSEICTCGIAHSISPEDHEESCRGNTLIRRLQGPPA